MGGNCLQIAVWWKSPQAMLNAQLILVEDLACDGSFVDVDVDDPSAAQGLILANQIIQRHSGSFQLLTDEGLILGFQIQLPSVDPMVMNLLLPSSVLHPFLLSKVS